MRSFVKKAAAMRGIVAVFCFLASALAAGDARALLSPHPIATDGRIRTVRYSPDEVFKFTGHYGYASVVEFSPGEEILTVSLGTSVAWQVTPNGNRLFIKPVEQDALTNMSVLTNKHMYHFELHAREAEGIRDKKLILALRFAYPDEDGGTGGVMQVADGREVPDLSDPEVRAKLNFNYTLVGSDQVAPIRIFDDGEFTYMQFRDKNTEFPAVFYVDRDGSEGILNFRTRGDYIVLERVSPVLTLRSGPDIVCVFNENMKLPPKVKPVEERSLLQRLMFWN